MKKEILRLEHLNFSVGGTDLMKDLSLNVFNHEIFCILGLVDAGKTLLADYLTGKKSIDSGRVYYNDSEIRQCRNLSEKGLSITHITNDTTLIPELSIAKNFYIAIKSNSKIVYTDSKAAAFAQSCLNDLEINICAKNKADSLNKCHQHIVAMCIAFYCHAKLIIVDDAMSGYSAQDIIDFQKFLNSLRRHDISIMIMTHSIEYATILSDRIAILKNGRNIKIIEKERFDKNVISKILLGEPPPEQEYDKKTENSPITERVTIYDELRNEFSFAADKGSVVGIFDPGNILCDSLELMRREPLKNPLVYSEGGRNREIYTVNQALEHRTAILFEDYFTNTIFKNVDLKDNIELLSLGKLARGFFGYIAKRREKVFLQDSGYYRECSARKQLSMRKRNTYECQRILLERLKMFNPELVLCIKSMAHLDPALINITFERFHAMAECGATVFVLSNDYSAFSQQFDSVFVVKNRKIQARLSHDELMNTDFVAKYLISTSSGII